MRTHLTLALTLIVLGGGGAARTTPAAVSPQTPAPVTAEARERFAAAWARQSRAAVDVPADGARVVIVKFNDYECPGCAQAERLYKPVLAKFEAARPGVLKYVVKDWPWNSQCNFNARTIPGHEASCDAAVAARVARDRGRFEEMTAWLFANQRTTVAAVREAAGRILGVTDFEREYGLKLPEIRRDIADGGVLRVDTTPTYFINGVRLPSSILPPELFELAITLEITRAP